MANTWYVNPTAGNDANNGNSFATAWKNLSAATSAKGVVSGDTVRIKEAPLYNTGVNATWTSVTERGVNPFAAQTITSASNAAPIVCTLTNHGYSTGDVIQITGAAGNTAANGNWKVTVVNANSFSLDDSSGNGAWTSGGTVNPIFCRTIKTASALVKPIASFAPLKTVSLGTRSAWVGANANIITALTATFGKGAYYDTITITVGATTGKMAYYTLPSTLDLSGYQQLSLFINQSSGTTLGGLTISLCSDTTGDTPVNTFTIPSTGATATWCPFTFDNGSALGSSIKSISISRAVNNGAQTFQFNSIVACKAPTAVDGISNTSLVTKNNGTEGAYSVGGFGGSDGSIIFLDSSPYNNSPTTTSGAYYGTSETVSLWRYEPFNPFTLNSVAFPSSGAANSYCTPSTVSNVTYSGGWNSTDMSTRTGQTWFTNQNGLSFGITSVANSFLTFDRINYCRCTNAINIASTVTAYYTFQNSNYTACASNILNDIQNGSHYQLQSCIFTNGASNGIYKSYVASSPSQLIINNNTVAGVGTSGIYVGASGGGWASITNNTVNTCGNNGASVGIYIQNNIIGYVKNNNINYSAYQGIQYSYIVMADGSALDGNTIKAAPVTASYFIYGNSTFYGVSAYSQINFTNLTISSPTTQYSQGNNTAVGFYMPGAKITNGTFPSLSTTGYSSGFVFNQYGNTYLYNCTNVPAPLYTSTGVSGTNAFYTNACIFSQDESNTAGNNKIYYNSGLVTSQTAVRHTPSGYAWSIAPTSTSWTSSSPMKLKIASVAANSGSPVTISAWMRRTNTGLTMQLVCPANQPYGPTTDTTSSMTAAADTWEQVSISFTPTQNGVFDIYAYAYGGTTYTGYVDDLSVSQ